MGTDGGDGASGDHVGVRNSRVVGNDANRENGRSMGYGGNLEKGGN